MHPTPYCEILDAIARTAMQCGRDPDEVKLVAVTKGVPWAAVQPVYDSGQRDFGESRVGDALEKMEQAPKGCRWHLIGSLQKNKVRKVIGKFLLIHSVDSVELARKISDASIEAGIRTSVLLQANVSGEKSKQGLSADEWKRNFHDVLVMPGITVKGLMTMAPATDDQTVIRSCFRKLRELRDQLGESGGSAEMKELSMGMSGDFRIAVEEGATLVRIGSAIFG